MIEETKKIRLGELQLAIMRVIWGRGEGTVQQVHGDLAARGLAVTTIATMLKKMEKRGLIAHRSEGRAFVYRATITEGQVIDDMVSSLAERHFRGRVSSLVSHLVSHGDIDRTELAELKAMIEAATKKEEEG